MAKIKLEIDALRVESFDTAPSAAGHGTVRGHQEVEPGDAAAALPTDWKTCQGGDCTPRTICHNSCLGECYADDGFVVGARG